MSRVALIARECFDYLEADDSKERVEHVWIGTR